MIKTATKYNKAYMIALIIIGLTALLQYIAFFRIPFYRLITSKIWEAPIDGSLLTNISIEFESLFRLISVSCLWIGLGLCAKRKTLKTNTFISVFVYYFFCSFSFELIAILCSSNRSFNVNLFSIINLLFFVATLLFYSTRTITRNTTAHDTALNVTKKARFFNYCIDTLVFGVLFMVTVFSITGQGRMNFEYLGIINSHIAFLYLFFRFIYYFFSELLFLTTLGKVHNNASVLVNNRFKDLFIRTLARCIPLEAFSFLMTKNGLHDKLSGTSVVVSNPNLIY